MRVSGVTLPPKKRIEIGLTYVYGIGKSTSQKILTSVNIDYNTKVENLTEEEQIKIQNVLKDMMIEGDLRRTIQLNIKRLSDISSYRGIRHKRGLPLRGQRTKTNARTRKGKKRTVANKKVATK